MIRAEIMQIGGEHVAVRQVGAGPAIVFVHGNSCSSLAWSRQLASPLADRFRLVAIDLPGHGDSAFSADPGTTNTLPAYAEVVARVSSSLGADRGVFVGWSMGGHILLEATHRLPNAAGICIIGAPPIARIADYTLAATDDPAVGAGFRADSSDEEVRALLSLFVRPGAPTPAFFFDDFRRADKRARAAFGTSLARGAMRDEVEIVATMTQPLAIVQGVEERIATNRRWYDTLRMPSLWRGAVQDVPEAGHAVQWEQAEAFNRLLESFASDAGAR